MKLIPRYLLCLAALQPLFSAYCQPFIYPDLNSLTGSMTISPEIEDKSSSFSYYNITAEAFSKAIAASTRIMQQGITNYPTHYFYPRIKYLISGYPFKHVSAFSLEKKDFKVEPILYTDTILKGGVWKGAGIGALIGVAVVGTIIVGMNITFFLTPTTSQWVQMVGWGILNGAGIGGFAGFGRQKRKQRQLNQQ